MLGNLAHLEHGGFMATFSNFLYWYGKLKNKECTVDYARQMVGFHQTTWYRLRRDYENGEDISKYFSKEEYDYGRNKNSHDYKISNT